MGLKGENNCYLLWHQESLWQNQPKENIQITREHGNKWTNDGISQRTNKWEREKPHHWTKSKSKDKLAPCIGNSFSHPLGFLSFSNTSSTNLK